MESSRDEIMSSSTGKVIVSRVIDQGLVHCNLAIQSLSDLAAELGKLH